MKEINGYVLCEVPVYSGFFEIKGNILSFDPNVHDEYGSWEKLQLPKGNYSIIGLAKDLTEEQWKGIVESFPLVENGQVNYYYPNFTSIYKTKTNPYVVATESGHSLLKANNLNPDNCLILKKIL